MRAWTKWANSIPTLFKGTGFPCFNAFAISLAFKSSSSPSLYWIRQSSSLPPSLLAQNSTTRPKYSWGFWVLCSGTNIRATLWPTCGSFGTTGCCVILLSSAEITVSGWSGDTSLSCFTTAWLLLLCSSSRIRVLQLLFSIIVVLLRVEERVDIFFLFCWIGERRYYCNKNTSSRERVAVIITAVIDLRRFLYTRQHTLPGT